MPFEKEKSHQNTASYLIGSKTIRFLNCNKCQASSRWLDDAVDPPTLWTVETLKKRCEDVFDLAWNKLKIAVLVNTIQLPIEYVQTAVDIASKHAEKVYVITPLIARIMYAIAETKLKLSIPGEKALIALFANEYFEIYEIEVINDNFYGFVNAVKGSSEKGTELLLTQIKETAPSAVILLSAVDIRQVKILLEKKYDGIIHSFLDNPYFIVLSGALAKTAALFPGNFDPPMDILNISNGFKVEYFNDYGKEEIDLIPFGEELPVEAIIELTNIKSFSIRHNEELTVESRKNAKCKREKTKIYEINQAGTYKITASINNYGIPHLKIDPQIDRIFLKSNPSLFKENQIQFIIKLKANYGSIWCKYNDNKIIIKNANNNEWTPLYISFLNSKVVVGEKAIQDFQTKPEYVVADIHKVMAIPIDNIKFNDKWKFCLTLDPENLTFATYELETFEGPRCVSPHFIMSLLLTAIKKIAEAEFSIKIKKLNIQLSNSYSKEQMNEIKKAAETDGIEIDSIEYADFY